MEREPKEFKPVLACIVCLPDIRCEAIGVLGKIKARMGNFLTLNDKWIIWEKIEECRTRKEVMETYGKTTGI